MGGYDSGLSGAAQLLGRRSQYGGVATRMTTLTPVKADAALAAARPSLKNSRAYQYRIPLTAIVLLGSWLSVLMTAPWIEEGSSVAWGMNTVAWGAFAAGALIRIWATLWIGGRKKQTIVDDGPYRVCRNPLYLGTFAVVLGVALFMKSAVFAAGLAFVWFLYVWYVVPAEEWYMRGRFVAAYDDYCRRVPRWLPRLSQLHRNEIVRQVADRRAVSREFLRMMWWILLPLLAVLTCNVRGTAWWESWFAR
jgi:protein-S-isoprenylcysteine O-methyltransferase Ste14